MLRDISNVLFSTAAGCRAYMTLTAKLKLVVRCGCKYHSIMATFIGFYGFGRHGGNVGNRSSPGLRSLAILKIVILFQANGLHKPPNFF